MGHSAGGLSLTQAMGKFAGKIRVAVFVSATMLRSGFCTDQDLKDVNELLLFPSFAIHSSGYVKSSPLKLISDHRIFSGHKRANFEV